MKTFFLFTLFVSSVFSVDPSYLLSLTESDPAAIVDGKVNVITGDLYLVESDLEVQGYEPISLVRSYMSHERGDWTFIPHVNALAQKRGDFWVVTEKYGTSLVYKKTGREKIDGEKFYRYEPLGLEKGFSNTSQGVISGETNLKNNYLLFDKKYKEFVLCSSHGSKRRYHKNHSGEGQFRLVSEKLPNGKQVVYEYQETKDKYLGTIFNLTSIATKNPSGSKTFAKAHFHYEDLKRKNKHFFIRGSDEASVEYQFRKRERDGYHSGGLESVVSSVGPDLHLKTMKHRPREDWSFKSGERVLTSISSSGKKNLGVDYYLKTIEQVRRQSVELKDSRQAISANEAGNTTRYTYDSANRLIQKEKTGFDGISSIFLYTYDTKNNLVSETDGRGNITKYVRTPFGEIAETHFPPVLNEISSLATPIIRSQFDSAGNETQQIDPQGFKRQSSYNARGKPIWTEHPGGGQEKFTYYLSGSLKKQMDPVGLAIDYTRDYLDRVICKTFIHNGKCLRTEKFDYTGLLLTAKTDPENHRIFYFYDRAARKIAEECEGEKTTFYYDPLGRIDKTETNCLQTLFQYDLLDRLEEKTEMDSTTNQLLRKITYQYDRANNITAIKKSVDGEDSEESFGYDSQNRLIWHVFSTGSKETFAYNDNYLNEYKQKVLQKTHTDPHGLQTIETYDALDRLVHIEQRKEKTLSEVKKTYNLRGDLSLQIDTVFAPDGSSRQIRTKWDYDPAGRVSQLTEAEGTLQAKITKYTYTLRGDKETITKPDGTILKYTTNAFGDVIKITSSDHTVAHEMRYDSKGNLIWNDKIERNWDAKGRLLSEVFPDLQHTVINSYNFLGQRTQCKIPLADCWIEYKHNALDMTELTRKNMCGTDIYSFEFSHDLSGNLQQIQLPNGLGHIKFQYDKASRKIGVEAPFFSQSVTQTDLLGHILTLYTLGKQSQFVYDDLYQLTSERGLFHHNYTYDSLFCRIQKNNEPYQVNDLNQLTSHFEYDKNGNPKRQGNTFYTCDALDRLIRMETESEIYTYTYDGMHRKIASTKESKNTPFRQVRYSIYDGQNEIGSFDEQGHLQELRILGVTPHAEIGATLAIELNSKTYLSIPDLRGNMAALLPTDQSPTQLTCYSAFGEEMGSKMSPWRFASKRVEETGLVHFGRRYYVPSLGRWLTPDPLGFHDGMNLYAYVHNNPLNHFDEYGLLDYGQYDKDWHQHSKRCHKALVHEVGTQAVDLIRLAFSTPYYAERGLNYVTGRQNYRTQNWHRCQNRFFDSANNWIYQTYSTDMNHSGYLNMRRAAGWGSLAVGGYGIAKGLARGGMKAASWGVNTWKTPHSKVLAASSFEGLQAGKNFKPFTKSYYRENLKILTDTYPPRNIEAHHVFAQQFNKNFLSKGINIHDPKYLSWWEKTSHRTNANQYNSDWMEFIKDNPKATLPQILQQGKEMMSEYGIKTNY
jgi:RHS repeat-associated protein